MGPAVVCPGAGSFLSGTPGAGRSRTVRWLGGSSDVVLRLLAQTVSRSWNQPVVIDNRVGATGAIAGEYVVRQPADGYTLLNAAPTSHTALRALRRDLPYDPMADLVAGYAARHRTDDAGGKSQKSAGPNGAGAD